IFTTAERAAELDGGGYDAQPTGLAASSSVPVEQPPAPAAAAAAEPEAQRAPLDLSQVHSSAELLELQQGRTADAPLCMNCGIKMRPSGSCYVCEGCGSTSGCS